MNDMVDSPQETFTFWLHDWATTVIFGGFDRPGCILCEIDSAQLRIFGGPRTTETPIGNIESAKLSILVGVPATVVTINVILKLKRQIETPGRMVYSPNELVIAPMDVYRFQQSHSESKTMIKVIQALQAGATPDVEPNPYLRCRRPRTHVPREAPNGPWDPTVAPYVYSEPPFAVRRLWIFLFVIFVLGPIITLMIGLIVALLLGQVHIRF